MPPAKKEDPLPTVDAREEFIAQLQQEPWLAGILVRLEKPRFKMDESIIVELNDMATIQATSFVDGTARLPVIRHKSDLFTLQTANAECLAHRGRVTEIVVSYLAVKYALDTLWDAAEAKLQAQPAYKYYSNGRGRDLFVAAVLSPLHERRLHVDQVLKMAEHLKEALTHTHFAIRQQSDLGLASLSEKSA